MEVRLLSPAPVSTSDWERSAPTERGYPQAVRAFEWGSLALVFWLQIGGYLDGWAHQHLSDFREDFFTPWHAVLYSGFTAVMLLLGTTFFRNLAVGRPARRTLPAGYELSFIGGISLPSPTDSSCTILIADISLVGISMDKIDRICHDGPGWEALWVEIQ